jgi:hypothetical protein
MRRRLSDRERAELEHKRDALRRELHLLEAELKADDLRRLPDVLREASEREGRPRMAGRSWRACR